MIRLLVARKADLEARNSRGGKPLHEACMSHTVEAMSLLLDLKSNIDAADDRGWTPLIYAAYFSAKIPVSILLQRGANLELRSTANYGNLKPGSSALDAAKQKNSAEVVQLLESEQARRAQGEMRSLSFRAEQGENEDDDVIRQLC